MSVMHIDRAIDFIAKFKQDNPDESGSDEMLEILAKEKAAGTESMILDIRDDGLYLVPVREGGVN